MEILTLFFKSCFSPLYCTKAKGRLGQFGSKNMSTTLNTPPCFAEPQVGQDFAAPLQEWFAKWHRQSVQILQNQLWPEQKPYSLH